MDELNNWRRLLAPEASALLKSAAIAGERPSPADIQRLRRDFPDEPVTQALELTAAREAGERKFPNASSLICDRQGMEQATSRLVADWKARRFGNASVLDLCSGIGGDAMSLARRGETVGVDHSEVRAFMCGHNAGISVRTDDVTATAIDAPLVHIDPARREEATGRRSWRIEDLKPSLDEIMSIVKGTEGAAIKLGPGIPRSFVLPWPKGWEETPITLEFIAESRNLVQAVAWTGSLASEGVPCRATEVEGEDVVEGPPGEPPFGDEQIGQYLLLPHPVVERAQLITTALCGAKAVELAPGLGLLTTDDPIGSVWFDDYEVLEVLPPRIAKVSAWLSEREAGPVVVRTRDGAIDADEWTSRLQGDGDTPFTIFGLRLGRKKIVIFVTRQVL